MSVSEATPRSVAGTDAGVVLGATFRTRAELEERAARGAALLRSHGVGAGDTVAVLMRNDIAFLEVSLAAARVGAAPVPINWHGQADEVLHVLQDCGAPVLVAHADLLNALPEVFAFESLKVICADPPAELESAYGLSPSGCEPLGPCWDEQVRRTPPDAAAPAGEPLSMIYTSGTTGRPKGVRRLPRPVAGLPGPTGVAPGIGTEIGMRTVITGPMYHTAPNSYALKATLLNGFLVLQPRFDPERLLALVEQHRITHLHMVPTMFVRLLKLPRAARCKHDLSSLQDVVHAAAPCPPDVKRAMIEWWGPVINEYYGATETGAVTYCTSEEWLAHPGTVGRPLGTATVRVLDPDGNDVSVGEVGEIFMRNSAYPDFTYHGKPDARSEVERDGLISGGDLGYVDGDGYLFIVDRKRDMVISGGVNIYPVEIEACIVGIDGVIDCAVFGAPDAEYGEHLVAVVELADGACVTSHDVEAHVRARLAGYKVPKHIDFQKLPRHDSGKIFKRVLRDRYWDGSGRRI